MAKERSTFSPAFKTRVALEALREHQTVAQLAAEHGVHANQITLWKRQLREQAAAAFGGQGVTEPEMAREKRAAERQPFGMVHGEGSPAFRGGHRPDGGPSRVSRAADEFVCTEDE